MAVECTWYNILCRLAHLRKLKREKHIVLDREEGLSSKNVPLCSTCIYCFSFAVKCASASGFWNYYVLF